MGAKRASKNAKQRAREGKEGAALPGGGRGLERGGGNHTLEVLRSLPPDGCSLSKVVVLKIGALILIESLPKFTICYKSTYYSTPCSISALRLMKNCYLIAGRWWFLKIDSFFHFDYKFAPCNLKPLVWEWTCLLMTKDDVKYEKWSALQLFLPTCLLSSPVVYEPWWPFLMQLKSFSILEKKLHSQCVNRFGIQLASISIKKLTLSFNIHQTVRLLMS